VAPPKVSETSVPAPIASSADTAPDPLPGAARRAIDLIEGEAILQVWKTPLGFLVLTNLRCLGLWQTLELFAPRAWRVGPEFFFYNLRPPTVVLGRFVELAEEVREAGSVGRFAVHDPGAVAHTISAAMDAGRAAWAARREETERLIEARQQIRRQRAAGEAHPIVMVRCSYCGNQANAALHRCPSCGARLG
jgi:hypothetical protein